MKISLYQQAEDLSWKVIQERGINRLPMNLEEICKHEISHVLLEHVEKITFYRSSEFDSDAMKREFQGNIFAIDLLMPATVLSVLSLQSAENFAHLQCKYAIS